MGIYTNSLVISGNVAAPVYTSMPSSNVSLEGDLRVNGSIFSTGRMDVGTIIFATFRLTSNISFNSTRTEIYPMFNRFAMDFTYTHMTGMESMASVMAVPSSNIYNAATGEITVPVTGFYSIQLQGVFQNDPTKTDAKNGVYMYFQTFPNPNARVAAAIAEDGMLSTTHVAFLLGGDRFLPVFYSNDPSGVLKSSNGETYVSFTLLATATTAASGYVRTPITY